MLKNAIRRLVVVKRRGRIGLPDLDATGILASASEDNCAATAVTVLGELRLRRWYYHEDGAPGVSPLDADVNLPQRKYSYFLQELLGHRVGRMAYDDALGEVEQVFGFHVHKHSVEDIASVITWCSTLLGKEIQMPKRDGTGPPTGAKGPRDGRGRDQGKGRAPGKGAGGRKGGKKGPCK